MEILTSLEAWLSNHLAYGRTMVCISNMKMQLNFIKWLQIRKNAEAQCNLAYCYMMGYGGDVDAKEIAELFKKAAKQANPPAEYYLGWCYENGYGIDTDYEQARNWYKKASDHGVEAAKLALHFYGSESYLGESR